MSNYHDLRKSRIRRLKARDKKSMDHHLPVVLASMLASIRFLLPFSIWNSPTSPISMKAEVLSSWSRTTLDILAIRSWILSICFLVYSNSFCLEIFSKMSRLDSLSSSGSSISCFFGWGIGVWYFPFSPLLSIEIVLYTRKCTIRFSSFFSDWTLQIRCRSSRFPSGADTGKVQLLSYARFLFFSSGLMALRALLEAN